MHKLFKFTMLIMLCSAFSACNLSFSSDSSDTINPNNTNSVSDLSANIRLQDEPTNSSRAIDVKIKTDEKGNIIERIYLNENDSVKYTVSSNYDDKNFLLKETDDEFIAMDGTHTVNLCDVQSSTKGVYSVIQHSCTSESDTYFYSDQVDYLLHNSSGAEHAYHFVYNNNQLSQILSGTLNSSTITFIPDGMQDYTIGYDSDGRLQNINSAQFIRDEQQRITNINDEVLNLTLDHSKNNVVNYTLSITGGYLPTGEHTGSISFDNAQSNLDKTFVLLFDSYQTSIENPLLLLPPNQRLPLDIR